MIMVKRMFILLWLVDDNNPPLPPDIDFKPSKDNQRNAKGPGKHRGFRVSAFAGGLYKPTAEGGIPGGAGCFAHDLRALLRSQLSAGVRETKGHFHVQARIS